MNEVNVKTVKSGKVGRPGRVVVLADGTEIPFKEWKKSQPKGKRGRKPMPRDAEGNIIREAKAEVTETVAETPATETVQA